MDVNKSQVPYLDEVRSPLCEEIYRALCMGARDKGLWKGSKSGWFTMLNSAKLTKTDASTIRSPSAPFTRRFESTTPYAEFEDDIVAVPTA